MFEKIKAYFKKKSTAEDERDARDKENPEGFVAGKISEVLTSPIYNHFIENVKRLTAKFSMISNQITVAETAVGSLEKESFIKTMFLFWVISFCAISYLNAVVFYSLLNLLAIPLALAFAIIPSVVILPLKNKYDELKINSGKTEKSVSFYIMAGVACLSLLLLLFVELIAAGPRAGFVYNSDISRYEILLEQEQSDDAPEQDLIALYQSKLNQLKGNKTEANKLFNSAPALLLLAECYTTWHGLCGKAKLNILKKHRKEQNKVRLALQKEEDARDNMIWEMRNYIVKKLNDWGMFTQDVLGWMGLNTNTVEGEIQEELPQRPLSTEHDVVFGNVRDDAVNDTDESIEEISRQMPKSENKNNGFFYDFQYDD